MPRPPINDQPMTPQERKKQERLRRKVLGHRQWWLTPDEQRLIIDYRLENPPDLENPAESLLLPPELMLGTGQRS